MPESPAAAATAATPTAGRATPRRRFMQAAAAAALGAGVAWPARAAAGRMLFGYVVTADSLALMNTTMRELQTRYRPDLGATMAVLPGDSGVVALEAANRSAADGATVLLAASSTLCLLPNLRRMPGADPAASLIAVAPMCEFTNVLVVGAAVPASVTTVNDFIAWTRDNPLQANYAVPGLGTSMHFVGMSFASSTDMAYKPVGYRSLASIVVDLKSGAIASAVVPVTTALYAARDPNVRILAVAGDERWPGFPEVPTLLERGITAVATVESLGFFLPAGTPEAKVEELREAVAGVVRSEAFLAALRPTAMRPVNVKPQDYAAALARERAAWAVVVKKHQVKIEN